MAKIKNYTDLTDKLLDLYDSIEDDKISLDKATTLIKNSDAIMRVQVGKIRSTKVTGKTQIKFFKD